MGSTLEINKGRGVCLSADVVTSEVPCIHTLPSPALSSDRKQAGTPCEGVQLAACEHQDVG